MTLCSSSKIERTQLLHPLILAHTRSCGGKVIPLWLGKENTKLKGTCHLKKKKKILPYMEGEGEEPEFSDIDDDPDPVGDQHQPGNQQPRRQLARNRQMPARFKDFVMEYNSAS